LHVYFLQFYLGLGDGNEMRENVMQNHRCFLFLDARKDFTRKKDLSKEKSTMRDFP